MQTHNGQSDNPLHNASLTRKLLSLLASIAALLVAAAVATLLLGLLVTALFDGLSENVITTISIGLSLLVIIASKPLVDFWQSRSQRQRFTWWVSASAGIYVLVMGVAPAILIVLGWKGYGQSMQAFLRRQHSWQEWLLLLAPTPLFSLGGLLAVKAPYADALLVLLLVCGCLMAVVAGVRFRSPVTGIFYGGLLNLAGWGTTISLAPSWSDEALLTMVLAGLLGGLAGFVALVADNSSRTDSDVRTRVLLWAERFIVATVMVFLLLGETQAVWQWSRYWETLPKLAVVVKTPENINIVDHIDLISDAKALTRAAGFQPFENSESTATPRLTLMLRGTNGTVEMADGDRLAMAPFGQPEGTLGHAICSVIAEVYGPRPLVMALGADSEQTSQECEEFFQKAGAKTVPQLKTILLLDRNPDTRALAAIALGLVGLQECVAPLLQAYLSYEGQEDNTLFHCTGSALERIGSPAVGPLCEALKQSESEMRFQIPWLLARIGDRAAVPALLTGLKDSEVLTREECARALGELGDERAIPALQAASTDDVEEVRAKARKALDRLRQE